MIHELIIIATGEKNLDAKGNEVWFRALKYPDGREVPLESLVCDEGWTMRQEGEDRYLVASARQPATLRWSGEIDGPMTLILGTHDWSGFAKLRWNGREDLIDLCSTGGYRVIDLPVDRADAISETNAERRHRILPTRRNAALITAHSPSVWTFLNPLTMFQSLLRHRYLIWQFTTREVTGRYKGSFFGLFWSFLTPLLLLMVYTFVFGVVFHGRWGQDESQGIADFALKMFSGLIMFNIFSECLNRAPGVIIGSQNYVKKVVFPLEIFPVSILGGALIHALISMFILILGQAIFLKDFPYTLSKAYCLPLVLLPLMALNLGLGWFLSSLGVFIRDIGHAIAIVVQVLFYITPVFYPIEALPEWGQVAMRLNPMAVIVNDTRKVMIRGQWPDFTEWAIVMVVTAIIMQCGYAWFMKTKRGFADVI